MAEAHRNLYHSNIDKMPTTHLYVKFLPHDLEDMWELEATGEFFYDYPLTYEVVTMGDYYQQTNKEELPELYAIVSPNFNFPQVAHETIDALYLDKSDLLLVAESFRLTGNNADIKPYLLGEYGSLGIDDLKSENLSDDALYSIPPPPPDCPDECPPRLTIDDSNVPVQWVWICDCYSPPPPPPPVITNDCGCPVFADQRKPAGCVKVEDTELSTAGNPDTFEPVRRVKVIMKDTWFSEDETSTDDHGCWKIDKRYKGSAWLWVSFKNERAALRGVANNWHAIWEWIVPVKDYAGVIGGPTFNDVSINYEMWTEQGSRAQRYWGAATVNNALHEFHDFAQQDGILPPPNGLDIHIGKESAGGYALMASQNVISQAVGSAITIFFHVPFAPILGIEGYSITQWILPEVHIGIQFLRSDRQKRLAYHEIAHASHYAQVGKPYWDNLVVAESLAGGHGNANSFDAGRISLCESWADYIAHDYAHRTYGDDNSVFENWDDRIDRTWNEVENHTPIGLHHDLVDIGEPPTSCLQEDDTVCTSDIEDDVSGFNNQQLFSCLTVSTTTVEDYRDCLLDNYLGITNNTQVAMDNLFNSY